MRKKLFYIPGVISLIGLPIIIFLFFPEPKLDYRCFKLYIPSDEKSPKDGIPIFSKFSVYSSIKGKKIERVQLHNQGLDKDNEEYCHYEKLKFINDELKRLQFINDTSTVLKVEFYDESNFEDFIYVLNKARIYGYKRYAYIDDCIYFLPDKAYEKPSYNGGLVIDDFVINDSIDNTSTLKNNGISEWEIFICNLKYRFEDSNLNSNDGIILSSAFIVLILVPSIIRIRRTKVSLNENK